MISDRLPDIEPLLERIARAQETAAQGFRLGETSARSAEPFSRAAAADVSASDGKPLLSSDRVEVDRDAFRRLLGEIIAILRDWSGEQAPTGAGAGCPAVELDEAGLRALLEACIEGGEALARRAEAFGLDAEVFAPAARYAFAPFLRAYARELNDNRFDAEAELPGRCPVCGAEPVMAEFDADDGHRRLACGLCGTKWRFARLRCPFCGSEDQKGLGFLEVEGLDGLRADVCEACGRYVKTVDRRKVGEAARLDAVDAATPELDEAALSFVEDRRRETGRA